MFWVIRQQEGFCVHQYFTALVQFHRLINCFIVLSHPKYLQSVSFHQIMLFNTEKNKRKNKVIPHFG